MRKVFEAGLHSHRGIVRKATAAVLRVPKYVNAARATEESLSCAPPVFANSFPKSGTHLLIQLAAGLPHRVDYGAFLSSMTSSFQFRERSDAGVCRSIRRFAPGEIVRGHLFFKSDYVDWLRARQAVHYFVYRDPRDVVVSEAHYLRDMNRWHRLHPYFRRLPSIEEAIALSITGFDPPLPGIVYPNIAERYARYEGWLHSPECMAIRYEDLISAHRDAVVQKMCRFYADKSRSRVGVEPSTTAMLAKIAPQKSHTFRKARSGGWREAFTPRLHELFERVAGDLLARIGYEPRRGEAAPCAS